MGGAARLGYVFTRVSSRQTASGSVDCYHMGVRGGAEGVWEVHGVNGFTSTRKRMSLVVKEPSGQYVLYAKGADMMMANDCQVAIPPTAKEHLQAFAVDGLRTLVVAKKQLSEGEFAEWKAVSRLSIPQAILSQDPCCIPQAVRSQDSMPR